MRERSLVSWLVTAACGACVALCVSTAHAAVTVYEPFNYSGATLGGQGGSQTGLSGTWTDNAIPPNNTTNPGGFASTPAITGAVALSNDATSLAFPNLSTLGARTSDSDGGYATRTVAST